VIVLSSTTIPPSYYLKRLYLSRTTQDKQASSVLSEEIVHPYALVQKSETSLGRRRQSLPVAYVLNNRIVTGVRVLLLEAWRLSLPL